MYPEPKEPGYISWPLNVSGNVVTTPDNDNWDLANGITAVFTIRVQDWLASGNVDVLMAQRTASTDPWWDIRFNGTGALQVYYSDGPNPNISSFVLGADVVTTWPTNEWITFAVVFRPNVSGRRRFGTYLWEDEQWTQLYFFDNAGFDAVGSSEVLSIGAHSDGSNAFYGDIRYAALYKNTPTDEPGGDLVFEFDGSELFDPNVTEFVAKSGHVMTVTRNSNPNLALQIIPRTEHPRLTPLPGFLSMPGIQNNYLTVPYSDDWTITPQGITIVMKIRRFIPWDQQNAARFFVNTARQATGWDLRLTVQGHLSLAVFPVGNSSRAYTNAAPFGSLRNLALGVWHTIAVAFTPQWDSGNRRVRSFTLQNGEWVPLNGATSGVLDVEPTIGALNIGDSDNTGNSNYQGDIGYLALYQGVGDDLTPGGTLVFEFDGTELADSGIESFVSKSGHDVSVIRNEDNPLTIVGRIDQAFMGETPVTNAFLGEQPVSELELLDLWD